MRAANLATSKRLQRVLIALLDYKKHSTRDIIRRAKVCAVNSCISELRRDQLLVDQNLSIECTRKNGLFFYQLVQA